LSGHVLTERIGFKRLAAWLSWLWAALVAYLAWRAMSSGSVFTVLNSSQGKTLRVAQVEIAVLFALLAGALYWLSSQLQFSKDWSYRLAFLGSAGLGLIFWLVAGLKHSVFPPLGLLALASSSAFATGLLISGWKEGFWEDNNPPSAQLKEAVHRSHKAVIGAPDKTDPGKRIFDVTLALTGLVISLPLWVVILVIVWMEDPGPVFFIKNSVGKGGGNFRQFKFRTMVRGAESDTGPVLSQRDDARVLRFGGLLRKTALDELPQLINILTGEMSFVGPRPQRTILVKGYLEAIPGYAHRHRVLPGLSGLAQVAGDYFLTPQQKLRYDRLYVSHANLAFDLQLIMLAFLLVFWYRWKPGWNGRLPRKWMRFHK
jgi:lipopolysaccharide/colanic/teichoic acid biosynthesis glycosyltransferase